jgi:hypothetical protein
MIVPAPIFIVRYSMLYRPVNMSTKNKKGYAATQKVLLGHLLSSTANQEGITYDNNDDDVQHIGMMDIYTN